MQALAVRATPPESADAEREGDKPWQGVVANTLNLQRNGAVGFIDWLDRSLAQRIDIASPHVYSAVRMLQRIPRLSQ